MVKIVVISEDAPLFQNKDIKQFTSSVAYRAWPIFILSFIRLFFISIFERAFANYLYFYRDISESTLGFITSAGAVAYIFGPIMGQLITSKLGIKNSIVLSTVTTPILIGAQMIYFETWYLITIRVVSGLLLGVYWPNCYNLLSRWQSVSSADKSKSNFKNFNFSWNLGFIFGLLSGYLWAFTLNEYLTMTISWYISFLLLPFCFFLKQDSELNDLTINLDFNSNNNQENLPNHNSNHPMIIYSIVFSWLALITYTISKSIVRFSYPVFLKSFGDPSYYAYLIQLSIQIGQLTGLTLINYIKVYSRKLSVFTSLIAIILVSLSIIFIQNMLYISILSASVGIFIGLIQGTSLKIMIDYGAAKNTKKYSTINEILKGVGFGLTPIAAGFVAEINIYANFVFLSIFGFVSLILLIYLSRDIEKKIF